MKQSEVWQSYQFLIDRAHYDPNPIRICILLILSWLANIFFSLPLSAHSYRMTRHFLIFQCIWWKAHFLLPLKTKQLLWISLLWILWSWYLAVFAHSPHLPKFQAMISQNFMLYNFPQMRHNNNINLLIYFPCKNKCVWYIFYSLI